MPLTGVLIAQSLQVGSVLEGVRLTVVKISHGLAPEPVQAGQPVEWTLIDFEAGDDEAEQLANALERVLEPKGGWYCDFRNDEETFVVFAGRTFRYPRGDPRGRAEQPSMPDQWVCRKPNSIGQSDSPSSMTVRRVRKPRPGRPADRPCTGPHGRDVLTPASATDSVGPGSVPTDQPLRPSPPVSSPVAALPVIGSR